MKICLVGDVFHADGRTNAGRETDMTKLIVAFSTFAKRLETGIDCWLSSLNKYSVDCGTWFCKALGRLRLKCDGTRAETRFRLKAKRTSSFKSAGASVQSTTGSRGVRISGSNARYTMFRGSVKGTGYPLHSSVFPSLLHPRVTVCHYVSTGL